MKILTTSDLYYITGGGDDGGGGESTSDSDSSSDGESCSNSEKNACIAYCSRIALPTNDFGVAFGKCMSSCYNIFAGNNINYYDGEWAV